MSIYITGDIHGDRNMFSYLKYFCEKNGLGLNDWIICLGDVGLNYYNDQKDVEIKKMASQIPANLFCIHGNHDLRPSEQNGYKIKPVYGKIEGKMWHDIKYPNQFFAIDGEIYNITTSKRSLKALVCGGAYSVDKFYRIANGWNWFQDEQPDEATKEKVLSAVKSHIPIDVVLTHTCPTRFQPTELFIQGLDQSSIDKSTEDFLDKLYESFDQKPEWYFGHFHGNKHTPDYSMLYDEICELV